MKTNKIKRVDGFTCCLHPSRLPPPENPEKRTGRVKTQHTKRASARASARHLGVFLRLLLEVFGDEHMSSVCDWGDKRKWGGVSRRGNLQSSCAGGGEKLVGVVRQPRGSDITGVQSSERNLLDTHHPRVTNARRGATMAVWRTYFLQPS